MKPLTNAIQSSHAEGRDCKKDLYRFMLNYQATPHCTTGVPPSQLLFNRKIKTKLPQVESDDISWNTNLDVKHKDEHAKEKVKKNKDRKAQAQVSDLKIGETVFLSQRNNNKFSRRFDPSPLQVINIKGTMVTAIRNGQYVTRNIFQFKKIVSNMVEPELPDDDMFDAWEDKNKDNNSPQ